MKWRRFVQLMMAVLVFLLLALVAVFVWLVPQRGAGIVGTKGRAADQQWRFLFAVYGPGVGRVEWFARPQGVATDGKRLYVTDTDNHRVVVFDDRGHYLRSVGSFGLRISQGKPSPAWRAGQLAWPTDSAAAPDGTIWVADTVNRAIQRFDPAGRAAVVVPATTRPDDFAPGKAAHATLLERPLSVTVADNRIYVADGFRVSRFGIDGSPQGIFGQRQGGRRVGAMLQPWGMIVDARGSVAVADALNHRVEAFSPEGKLLWMTSTPTTQGAAGSTGAEEIFALPRGMDRDSAGRIYVADALRSKITVLSANGRKLIDLGDMGRMPAELFLPNDVALTRSGTIFVADKGNNRVQAFRLNVSLP